MVLGAPDRVNIPCLLHDTHLCQLDVKITNNYHGTKSIWLCKFPPYNRMYASPIEFDFTKKVDFLA